MLWPFYLFLVLVCVIGSMSGYLAFQTRDIGWHAMTVSMKWILVLSGILTCGLMFWKRPEMFSTFFTPFLLAYVFVQAILFAAAFDQRKHGAYKRP
jgi:K+ transporter